MTAKKRKFDNSTDFPIRLKQARMAKRLKQIDLSRLTGLGQSVISQFERNARKPAHESLLLLSQALQVSIDYLLNSPYSHNCFYNTEKLTSDEKKSVQEIINFLIYKRDT